MRRNLLTPVLACLLLLGGITASIGQTTTHISYTSQWSYLVTNSMPPGGWTNVNYPAAAGWPVAAAPMAFPLAEPVPAGVPAPRTALDTNFNGTIVTSFYFRASINLPSNPTNRIFTVNTVIDDGAVFYVNGRRVQNLRITAGAVTHNTLATASPADDARIVDTFTIASTNFVQGSNVIAVWVHQDAHTSSDVLFAMELESEVIQPPVIVSHPESQTVQVGRTATFDVGATGTALTYRWFTNGVAVLGAAGAAAVYTSPATTLAMDGIQYYVVVSNSLGRVQSQTATLRVVPDTFGPVLTNVFMARSNWVEMRFDELLDGSLVTNATSLTNFYLIELGSGQELVITNATLVANRRDVQLRLPAVLDPGLEYVVCAYNMRDTNGHVTPTACMGVGFSNTNGIIQPDAGWAYSYDSGAPAANWTAINYVYDPNQWAFGPDEGVAPFFQDQVFSGTLCGSLAGSAIDAIQPMTYYFRHAFTIPTGTDLSRSVRMQYLVDDGAVFYLNGTEIHRYNMPAGPVTHATLATAAQEANCNTSLTTNLSNVLRVGNNVLAVSVHQRPDEGSLNNDVVFGVNLSFVWEDRPAVPELTIIRPTATNIRVSWPTNSVHAGWVLETAPSLTGPWVTTNFTRVGASNVHSATIGAGNRFFRMRIH